MKKSNINGSSDKRNVNPEWFTGKTWMKVLSEKISSPKTTEDTLELTEIE